MSLDSRLCGDCTGVARTHCVCEAWRRIHSLCSHCAPATHPHLLSWLQRHTASTVLQTEWTKCEDQHALLAKAIDAFLEDCSTAISKRNGVAKYWEQQLQTRAHWFKSILPNPWGHPVLKALLDSEQSPSDEQILEWLKEERGVMFVTRLRQMAALKSCVDLALRLATAVMQRKRLCIRRLPDIEQIESQKEPAEQATEDSFAGILNNEAGFTPEIWEFLTDLEFVLLHKATQRSTCIDLAKQVPFRNACQLVERLQNRPNISPTEKKLWKNTKEVALLIAQVVITRCMVVPTCRGTVLMALYGCSRSIVRLMTEDQLGAASVALAAPAATAHHLHTMAAAVHKQLQGERTQFTCQLYVRAITAGMNELEKLKLDKNKSAEARFTEKTLSTWFKNLGALLCQSSRLKYECVLTAFSVHPSPGMYEEVKNAPHLEPIKDLQEPNSESTSEFGSWATDSRTQTNFVKTSETLNLKKTQKQANVLSTAIFSEGESLGLGSELCNDLAVLLSGPRVKTLSWDMEREALLDNCKTYMKKTDFGTRALSTELKYLNLDPRSFQHLPEEDENEDDIYYGIEKGYEHLVELQDPITDTIPPEIWQNVFYESPSQSSDDSITKRPKKERKKRKKKIGSNLAEDPLKLDSDIDAITCTETLDLKISQEDKDCNKDTNKDYNDVKVEPEITTKRGKRSGKREKKLKDTENDFSNDPSKQESKKDVVKKTALRKFLSMKVARKNSDLRRLIANTERMMFPTRTAESRDKILTSNTSEKADVVSNIPDKSEVVFDGVYSLEDMSFQETQNQVIRLKDETLKANKLLTQPITTEDTRAKQGIASEDLKNNIKKLISFRRNNFNTIKTSAEQKESSIKPTSVIKCPSEQNIGNVPRSSNDKINHNCSMQVSDAHTASKLINPPLKTNTPKSTYKTPGQQAYEEFVKSYETNLLNTTQPSQPLTSIGERQFHEFLKRYNNDYSSAIEPKQPLKYNKPSHHIFEESGLKYQITNNISNCGVSQSNTPSASRNIHSTIVNEQRHFQEFLKELQDSINPATTSKQKFDIKHTNASVCPKIIKVPKKAENVPNTFSRLSYLHKNKHFENKLEPEGEKKTQIIPNVDCNLKSMLPLHLQHKGQIQLSKIRKKSNVTDLILQGNEKATDTSKPQNHTNLFQADDSNLMTGHNDMSFQNVTKSQASASTMLSEKDQTDLLQLLRQKSKLNWSNAVINALPESCVADTVAQTTTWVNTSNIVAIQTAKMESAVAQNKHVYCKNNYTNKIGSLVVQNQHFQNPVNNLSGEPTKNNVIIKAPYTATTTYQSVQLKTNEQEICKLSNTSLNLNRVETKLNNLDQKAHNANSNPCGIVDYLLEKPTIDNKSIIQVLKNQNNKTQEVKTDYGLQLVNDKPQPCVKVNSLPKKPCTSSRKRSKSNQNKKSDKVGTKSWESVFNDLLKHKTPIRGPNALQIALQRNNVGKETPQSTQNNRVKANQHVNLHINSDHNKGNKYNSIDFSAEVENTSKAHEKFENKNFVEIHPVENDPFISGIPNSDYDLLDELMDDDLRQEIGELSDDDTYSPNRVYTQTEKVNIGSSRNLMQKPGPSQTSQLKAETIGKQKIITFNKSKIVTQTEKTTVEEKPVSLLTSQLRPIEKQKIFTITNRKGVTQTENVNIGNSTTLIENSILSPTSQLKAETIGKQKIIPLNTPKSVIVNSKPKPITNALNNQPCIISNGLINTSKTISKGIINKEHTNKESSITVTSQLKTEFNHKVVTQTDKRKKMTTSTTAKSNKPTSLPHNITRSADLSSALQSKTSSIETTPPILSTSHPSVQPAYQSIKSHKKSLLQVPSLVLQANNLKDMAWKPFSNTATTESDNLLLKSSDFLSKTSSSVEVPKKLNKAKNTTLIAQNTVIVTATTEAPIAQDLASLKENFAHHLPPLEKQPYSTNSCKLTYPTVLGSTVIEPAIAKELSVETRSEKKEGSTVKQNQLVINKSVIGSQAQQAKTTNTNVIGSRDDQCGNTSPLNSCLIKTTPKDISNLISIKNICRPNDQEICEVNQKLPITKKENCEPSNVCHFTNCLTSQNEIERIISKRLSLLNRPIEQYSTLSPIPLPYESLNDIKTAETITQGKEIKILNFETSLENIALSGLTSPFVLKTVEEVKKKETEKQILKPEVTDTVRDGITSFIENTTKEIGIIETPTIKSTLVKDCVSNVTPSYPENNNKPEIKSITVKDTTGDSTEQLDGNNIDSLLNSIQKMSTGSIIKDIDNKETTLKSKTPIDSTIYGNERICKNDNDTRLSTLLKPSNNLVSIEEGSISFVELPRKPNDDPTKRKIRIKANGTTLTATICGHLDVNIDSMFSEPDIRNLVLRNSVTKTACTINVKQRTITGKTKTENKTIVNTILYPPDVRSVKTEVIDLISDDESEEINEVVFKTEFGNFTSKFKDDDKFLKHQTKLAQKCTVNITRCEFLEKVIASKSVESLSKTLDKGYQLNKNNTDVIEINDSSNDSIIEISKPRSEESILKSNLITDFDVLRSSIIKGFKNNELIFLNKNDMINEINKINSKQLKHAPCSRRRKKCNAPTRSIIKTKKIELKKCFVRLVRCDLNHQNSDFPQSKHDDVTASCNTDLYNPVNSCTLSKELQEHCDTTCILHNKIEQESLFNEKGLENYEQEFLNKKPITNTNWSNANNCTDLIETRSICNHKSSRTIYPTSSFLSYNKKASSQIEETVRESEKQQLIDESCVSDEKVINPKFSSVASSLTNELPSVTRDLKLLSNVSGAKGETNLPKEYELKTNASACYLENQHETTNCSKKDLVAESKEAQKEKSEVEENHTQHILLNTKDQITSSPLILSVASSLNAEKYQTLEKKDTESKKICKDTENTDTSYEKGLNLDLSFKNQNIINTMTNQESPIDVENRLILNGAHIEDDRNIEVHSTIKVPFKSDEYLSNNEELNINSKQDKLSLNTELPVYDIERLGDNISTSTELEIIKRVRSSDASAILVEENQGFPSISECRSSFSVIKDYTVNFELLFPQTGCCAEWYKTKRSLNMQHCDFNVDYKNKLIENKINNYNSSLVSEDLKIYLNNSTQTGITVCDTDWFLTKSLIHNYSKSNSMSQSSSTSYTEEAKQKQCNNIPVLSLVTIMTNYLVNSTVIDISSPVIPQFYKYYNRKRRMIKAAPTSDNIMKHKLVLKKSKHIKPIQNCPIFKSGDIGKKLEHVQSMSDKLVTINSNIIENKQPINSNINNTPIFDKLSIEEFIHNEKILCSKFDASKSDYAHENKRKKVSQMKLNNIDKSKQGCFVKLEFNLPQRKEMSLKFNNSSGFDSKNFNEVKVEKPSLLNFNGNGANEPSDLPKKNITLLYKSDDSDLILEGSVYKDPVIGTCYLFPIQRSIKNDMKDISEVKSTDKEINIPVDVSIFESNFNVLKPKVTYSKKGLITDLYLKKKKNLKRKNDTLDYKYSSVKRYRKGKNINDPKTHPSASNNFAYVKEFRELFKYWESIKFSFSRPFHNENLNVNELHKSWPVHCAFNLYTDASEDDNALLLYHDEPHSENDPLRQSLAEEIASEGFVNEYKTIEINETNFSMGFGERSDRVNQQYGDQNTLQETSAAALSDVKPQPFSGSEYSNIKLMNSVKFQTHEDDTEVTNRFLNYIKQKNKVRSFFKQTIVELNLEWMSCNIKENGKEYKQYSDGLNPLEVHNFDFFTVPSIETIVQVVQVGQLPVSAAAQNPVTCDPRVTQVTDASPPQCSAENSPRDGSQPSVKTEYTELTTADLSLPLVEEYERQNNQAISLLSQGENNKLMFSDENIPIEKEVNSIVKIEIAEESLENEEQIDNEDSELQEIISQHTNNREFCFTNDSSTVTESDVLSFQNLNDTEPFLQNEERNEKTDQIAHAMSAAGITTSSHESQTIDNARRDKINEETSNISLTSSNNYSKTASINAISLQQALAQILPPPLNRTNTSDNQPTSNQVLHLVQGKNSSSVNQLTLMDNTQQSVLNASNSTPVLHIVQNKGQANSNNNTGHPTNSFNGLPLMDSNNIQQGSSQLLHIVNTSGQKTNNTGQLLKRVNLLTNLSNVQSGNEQKMVQFVCKSADGKSIQLNAPHQRSMVLRIQPIESSNVQSTKPVESHNDVNANGNATNVNENTSSQQEIKSRSVYEENYAKFIQNSGKSTITEKSTSLPKFNQAFGKQVFQDENQKVSITENHPHLAAVNSSNEVPECQNENSVSLDHIGHLSNPPLLLRKATPQSTTQTQSTQSLVTQLKQTITPMNLQTMHGGVIYTRQIPVNIGGGQTINLITVPSTELLDDSNQKQHNNSSDVEPSIIKIVSQNSTPNSEVSPDESRNQATNDTPNHQPQPVLTQMRIKLPMLSKPSQMVSGARVVRPSFFQIQRNVIGGANQPVYQQLVLTAAPQLGQQTIRLPQSQTNRLIKIPAENQTTSESQMSSSTLEQLREFDMVLEQVKERSTVQPNQPSSSNTFNKVHTPSAETKDTSSHSTSSTESTHQVLYTIGNNSSFNVAYVNRKATANPPTVTTFVRSPDSSNANDSPLSSTPTQVSHTVTTESQPTNELSSSQNQLKVSKISSKSKSRPKPTPNPSSSVKINPVPPKPSTQKPFEDEQTTQRILYILAEYKEQVENSPDKDKPAPRRRSNPPSNPGSSKRKKSSSSSRRPGTRDMSPVHGEDTCRTMGSEDSSCGTSQGDCTENCLDSHSPQDSPRKVVRKLSFEPETPPAQPRPQPQRNVIVADGQTITVARNNTGKPTTAVLMPANYILPVSMVKSGQQIAIVTNRGPKILTVGGGEGGGNTVLLQRLIGPGLKPVLTRPGVRHVRLPAAALQNLQAFTLGSTAGQQADGTASVVHPNPPELIDTRATSSPWAERESQDPKPEKQSSPGSTEPWNLASHDYSYEEIVRSDNMDRTVLDAIPDRYSPEMEAQRIFDKMFDIDSKKSYISQDVSPRCGYDIDASDCDDKPFHQVVHRKDGTTQRHHRLAHVSSAALRHRYAILEHELRLQKSLSEECEDLGVDSPSASELFPEAELLFSSSPAHEAPHHSHTPQPLINQGSIPQPDIDDQIATDQLISQNDVPDEEDLNMALGLDNIVTVSADGTITLDPQEFARSHPNTTFHKEPTDESELQPFTIANVKGRHMTSTIFHASRAPATVLVTAPQTTVISQAAPDGGIHNNLKYSDTPSNSQQGSIPSVLVKDNGVSKFDSMLNRELHLSNTASTIIHSGATQVIRRVCYDDDKHDPKFLESHALIGEDAKMAEDSRDATLESMADVDDDRSSPERNEMFWESNSTSERSEGRRPLDFSSDSDKCCKSPFEETNSTDSSGIGTHIMRLDSVIKDARGIERSGSADGSSADDTHPPLRTYPPKRYHPPEAEEERSTSGKTRAGERSPDSMESRRRASNRGVVKRGCHCCNGSPAPSKPKKSRPRKPNTEFTT
ncbi:uncharacterized protein LOC123714858 isoform X2 [Pieris brassicae]|uniref:uncharacterized protein LOC123714858 isoform X2 n=1 Tax=Pieris brassicae TaxID=7116 RepID=UPI001E65E555|nr:uncharacterized protein LOC123714858 isoform X2 [Pieris brassicae]